MEQRHVNRRTGNPGEITLECLDYLLAGIEAGLVEAVEIELPRLRLDQVGRVGGQTKTRHGDLGLAAGIEPADLESVPLILAHKRQLVLLDTQRSAALDTWNGIKQPGIVVLGIAGRLTQRGILKVFGTLFTHISF